MLKSAREKIIAYRRKTGCTQEWLAKRIGININTLSSIETGKRLFLRMSTVCKIEQFFDREEDDEL